MKETFPSIIRSSLSYAPRAFTGNHRLAISYKAFLTEKRNKSTIAGTQPPACSQAGRKNNMGDVFKQK